MSCNNCYNAPEIILKDNEYIILTCPNCNIIKNENLENISNYSSEWITNETNNFYSSKYAKEIHSSFNYNDLINNNENSFDLNNFEIFLERAEKIKLEKYSIINKTVTIFQNISNEDKE